MPTPRPDTSPANIARVLRIAHWHLIGIVREDGTQHETAYRTGVQANRIADALDALPTWKERVERAAKSCKGERADHFDYSTADTILRAAFPELAPPND